MAEPAQTGAMGEWRQHWTVVVPCLLGIMLAASHGFSLGVMVGPLEREFGWPRAQISAGFMFISAIALIAGPILGTAVDRFGPRRIALIGIPAYCAMLACLSLASSNIYSWWGLWALLATSSLGVMPVVWLAALNGYFLKSRGLAMAIALSGTGLAAALWPIVTNTLLEAFGWRIAYVSLGTIGAAVCFPVVWFLFREAQRPHSRPADRTDAHGAYIASPASPGLSPSRQMRSLRFFKLGAASIIFSIASTALTNNMVPVLIGEGLTPARAAATAGLLGIGSIVGRIGGGYLLDRFDGNKIAGASVLLPIVPATILLSTDQSQLWAGIACVVMGLSVGTEFDCTAYLAARHFGSRNFGTLFGTINGLLMFGAGIGPIAANHVFDVSRSYDLVMIGLIPLFVLTAILFVTLGSYRHLDQETGQPLAGPKPA